MKQVKKFREEVKKIEAEILSKTVVKLQGGTKCWKNECNLGNLVTDAMVHCAHNASQSDSADSITPIVSIWHSGSLYKDEVSPQCNAS